MSIKLNFLKIKLIVTEPSIILVQFFKNLITKNLNSIV